MTGDGFDLMILVRYDNRDTGYERGESLAWNYRMTDIKMLEHLNKKMEGLREILYFYEMVIFFER